jgi:hypothetical protein
MDNMAGLCSGKELINLTLKHLTLALKYYTKSNCNTFNLTHLIFFKHYKELRKYHP